MKGIPKKMASHRMEIGWRVTVGARGRGIKENHLEKRRKKKKKETVDYLSAQLYSRECYYSIKEFGEELMINT